MACHFPDPLAGDPALRGQRIFWDAYSRLPAESPIRAGLFIHTGPLRKYATSEVENGEPLLANLSEPDFRRPLPIRRLATSPDSSSNLVPSKTNTQPYLT
jgi:hypothetical protein